ncbi:activating signal cointegrator 1 complex subunit 3, putative [Rhizoctonia solani AG-3 Rhs1AP]|uniref:Activating signal cointegrator 1 complex subunit 3, putative n=1 Tax=Rhizoctonia solani AG-3 Rhs1AP TaxID=1086054 RepID=X8J5Y5_9AGAM|nr:activating signal cointegrator 1 complex subunit 3, putative [Rhizoctonia solani AG-3 Rhs1AP]
MSLRLGLTNAFIESKRLHEAAESWENTKQSPEKDIESIARQLEDIDAEENNDSVVYDFRIKASQAHSSGTPFESGVSDIISKLKSHGHLQRLLPSMGEHLVSDRPEDEVSNYILDLVGMDEMDLVIQVMSHRRAVGKALLGLESNPTGAGLSRPGEVAQMNGGINDGRVAFTAEEAKQRMEESLRANEERPLFSGAAIGGDAPEYPHVYTSGSNAHGNILSMFGSKFLLPLGTQRDTNEQYQEVVIPPAKAVPPRINERPIPVRELDTLARGCFPGYQSLNRIQSIVYPTAYSTNENMLICAPTGAGKTDVAMLTILRVIDQHLSSKDNPQQLASLIRRKDFKIIYVAPMKALAAEIVRKLGKRLAWLDIKVRELTGDMQLTKAEIAETQIIVTTPEKWDVVTRKPTGEGELASKIKLLIIDEIHLLNDERGAVIETIIARTLRQVESTQSVIRVVGLSATLPNYVDVADFVGANRERGLFYFDSSFRPVPLEQHFLGIKGKAGSPMARKNMDEVTFEKVSELVKEGHQVMVFVHARKETVKTALALKEAATADDSLEFFSCMEHPQYQFFQREMGASRNKEMKQLFEHGFGIHHAGMLRSDRNMMEKMFEARAIKVLCCTATLAWGVNLPAHAVIIKGTQVYDSARGSFVDLSVLDVLQIFGRAGRPGMETSGVGYICTNEEKLDHYLNVITSQHPIESKLVSGIVDSLNAEIALGTVSTLQEAVSWLGYTYLFVRMRRNPFHYGITREIIQDDPQLVGRRMELVTSAAKKLDSCGMVKFDTRTETLTIADLGLIAAKYYIRYASIEVYNEMFKPIMSESDVLVMLSKSTEFSQIQTRENEYSELEALLKNGEIVVCQLPEPKQENTSNRRVGVSTSGEKTYGKGKTGDGTDRKPSPIDTVDGKVNVLLQAYISKAQVQDFALVSDMAYVAQNGGRIIRALLEIAVSRKFASTAANLAQMSLAVEKRIWPFANPMEQFPELSRDLLHNLRNWADDLSPPELAEYNAEDLGALIHMNYKHGGALLKLARQFPHAELSVRVRPLTAELLRIQVKATRKFDWNTKLPGQREPFWLWVQDEEGNRILQFSRISFVTGGNNSTKATTKEKDNTDAQASKSSSAPTKAESSTKAGGPSKANTGAGVSWSSGSSNVLHTNFTIPLRAVTENKTLVIRLISDRWVGAVQETSINLADTVFPKPGQPSTPVLELPFLPLTVLRDSRLQSKLSESSILALNGMQTQAFYSVIQTTQNVLFAGPTANGKSTLTLSAVCKSLSSAPASSTLILTPRKRDTRDVVSILRRWGTDVVPASTREFQAPRPGRAYVTTPSKLLDWACNNHQAISNSSFIRSVNMIVLESLESLDAEYELAIAILRHATQMIPVRFIGITAPLTDTSDLANWLAVPTRGNYCFRPQDREQDLTTASQTFSIPHSGALFRAMAKPVYTALRSMTSTETAIVFVPAQGLCRAVIGDLVTSCGVDFNALGFLGNGATPDAMEIYTRRLNNNEYSDGVAHGIGVYHDRLTPRDQQLMLELYAEGTVRVLVAPRETCWSIPVRAARVVVMGTQYIEFGSEGDRELRDYSLGEVTRMQSRAVRSGSAGTFILMCQAEDRDTYMRFLENGLPLESELMEADYGVLKKWAHTMMGANLLKNPQDLLDILGHTYLRRRLKTNPNYYEDGANEEGTLAKLVDLAWMR